MKARWYWFLIVFLFLGVFLGTLVGVIYDSVADKELYQYAISRQVLFWLVWFGLYQPVILLNQRLNEAKIKRNAKIVWHGLMFIGTISIHHIIYFLISYFVIAPILDVSPDSWLHYFTINGLTGMQVNFIAYWAIVLIDYTSNYYRRYKDEELKSTQMAEKLANAELNALKMQLHPHFLFNTLHAISALMHRDLISAEKMINRLSDLLRYSLQKTGQQLTSLHHELEFLELYLEIEKVRFQDRLKVQINIHPELMDAEVPHLILQPLVENALKHGIAPIAQGGEIIISAEQSDSLLVLRVSDNGKSIPQQKLDKLKLGIGLQNTQMRLEQLYSDAHSFAVDNCNENGFEVTLKFPLKLIPAYEYQNLNVL
ncbi:hypothetical protein BKI52_04925 [marine bacterium AO1-C]|nr:hypothetical protein BKI52_04925 [marine bacterium AO1-C]